MALSKMAQQVADYLRENMGLEPEDIRELLNMLCESAASHISRAEQQLLQQDWDGLSRTGHAIKGSAANLGATCLAEAGKTLELAAKDGDSSTCKAAITSLKAALEELTGS